jgi:hypothetical protein
MILRGEWVALVAGVFIAARNASVNARVGRECSWRQDFIERAVSTRVEQVAVLVESH